MAVGPPTTPNATPGRSSASRRLSWSGRTAPTITSFRCAAGTGAISAVYDCSVPPTPPPALESGCQGPHDRLVVDPERPHRGRASPSGCGPGSTRRCSGHWPTPRQVVIVGHFDDALSEACAASTRESCRDVFVVEDVLRGASPLRSGVRRLVGDAGRRPSSAARGPGRSIPRSGEFLPRDASASAVTVQRSERSNTTRSAGAPSTSPTEPLRRDRPPEDRGRARGQRRDRPRQRQVARVDGREHEAQRRLDAADPVRGQRRTRPPCRPRCGARGRWRSRRPCRRPGRRGRPGRPPASGAAG